MAKTVVQRVDEAMAKHPNMTKTAIFKQLKVNPASYYSSKHAAKKRSKKQRLAPKKAEQAIEAAYPFIPAAVQSPGAVVAVMGSPAEVAKLVRQVLG